MNPSPKIALIYKTPPESDRWVWGDRWVRPVIRRLVRGPKIPSGIDKVFLNLAAGLKEIQTPFVVNPPWHHIGQEDRVGVIGRDRACLEGYDRPNPIMAGVALMTHPSEWPNLCEEYPVRKYLQHCDWAIDLYRPYFGAARCDTWPVGIDTNTWSPQIASKDKTVDFLLYDKVRWDHDNYEQSLIDPVRQSLRQAGCSFEEIHYGSYRPEDYTTALHRCRCLLFLCEHESQGIAYQEAMSAGLPVLAWDPEKWLDPQRFKWDTPDVDASSVPFFDERCGERFKNAKAFPDKLGVFLEKLRSDQFDPRSYILENLTLAKSAKRYVQLLEETSRL